MKQVSSEIQALPLPPGPGLLMERAGKGLWRQTHNSIGVQEGQPAAHMDFVLRGMLKNLSRHFGGLGPISFSSGQVAVYVGGMLTHRFEDRMLDDGYVLLGAKGGIVQLRKMRLSARGHAAAADDAKELQSLGC
jgi:hypothetical protein